MKLRLPQLLKAALLACFISASTATTIASGTSLADTQGSNLGNVMYIGDSITHGYEEASYRWALFKTLADNGIGQTEKGVKIGNDRTGTTIAPNSGYGGRIFENIHSAQSSARTYEVAGRMLKTPNSNRFDKSNIKNWLGQEGKKTNGDSYVTKDKKNGEIGATFTGGNAPNTYFIMLGTNDLLSDTGEKIATDVGTKQANLIGTTTDNGATWSGTGDMDKIIDSIRTNNSATEITITSIPCWAAEHSINTSDQRNAVLGYNVNLEKWSSAKNVRYIDVNKGLIDIASSLSFAGHTDFFLTDKLHPNAQGNLIIAGNIAKASGYAGRSAGQVRKDGTAFTQRAGNGGNITLQTLTLGTQYTQNVSESIAWTAGADLSKGYTLDFQVKVGNGGTALQTNTWNTTNSFAVTLGNDTSSGTLNINEAYIQWGSTTLYSMDMSTNAESLRISYIMGDPINGLAAGFYVWLGDMLIGEALNSTANGTTNGVTLSYGGAEEITLDSLNMTAGSWAPNTSLYVNPNSSTHFIAGSNSTTPSTGMIKWKTEDFTNSNNSLQAANKPQTPNINTYNARAAISSTATGIETVLGGTITSGSAANIYANLGDYTGDIWLTIAGGNSTSWVAAHGAAGTLTGNAYLRFIDSASWAVLTVFGAVNAQKVTGNIYLEFSSAGMTYGSFTGGPNFTTGKEASVVGTYGTPVSGKITMVINAGTFKYAITGGAHNASTATISGGTDIYINGGILKGAVIAGGMGGTVNGGASITVSGGTIEGNLYGTTGGTVNGGTKILVQGGSLEGNIYGAGTTQWSDKSGERLTGNVTGGTSITLDGTHAVHLNLLGSIYGGSNVAGNVTGDTSITLSNFAQGTLANISSAGAIISGGSAGTGNVSGTKSLILENVQGDLLSTIKEFDVLDVWETSDVNLNYTFDTSGIDITINGSLGLTNDTTTITLGTNGQIKSLGGTGTLRFAKAQTLQILSNTDINNSLELGGNTTIDLKGKTVTINKGITQKEGSNCILTLIGDGTSSLTINRDSLLISDGASAHTFTGGTIVDAGTLILGGVQEDGSAGGSFQFGTGALTLKAGATVNLSLSGGSGNNYIFTNAWDIQGDSSIVFLKGGAANRLSGTIALADNTTLTLSMLHGSDNTGGVFLDGALSGGNTTKIVVENSQQTEWNEGRNLRLTANNDQFLGTIQLTQIDNTHTHPLALYLDHAQAATNASIILEGLGSKTENLKIRSSDLVLNKVDATIANLSGNEFSRLQSIETRTLTIANASGTFAGVADGTLSVVKQGEDKWLLSGVNTSTGSLTISAGSLELGGAAGTWAGAIVNNASLIFNHTATFTSSHTISGSGSVTKTGDKKLILTGANTSAGNLTISAGSLELGGAAGTWAGEIVNKTSLIFNHTGAFSFAQIISGVGTAEKTGAHKLTLTGANTSTGSLTISTGSLELGGAAGTWAGAIVNNASLIFNHTATFTSSHTISGSGTVTKTGSHKLSLTGANTSTGSLTISTGSLELGGAAGTWAGAIVNNASLIFNHTANFSFAQIISGGGTVTKTGTHKLTLTGVNTSTGSLTISAGSLELGGTAGTWAGAVINEASLIFNHTATFTSSHTISGTGTVTKTGVNTLTMSGANTYSGDTILDGGTLILGSDAGFSASKLIIKNGTLDLGDKTLNNSIEVRGTGSITNHTGYTGVVDVQAGGDLAATGMNLKISGDASLSKVIGGNEISHKSLQIENNVNVTLTSSYVLGAGQSISLGGASHLAGYQGTMTGDLTLNGGTLLFSLDGTQTQPTVDHLTVTGTLLVTKETTLKINRTAGSLSANTQYLLMTANNTLSEKELALLHLEIQKGRSVVTLGLGDTDKKSIYLNVGTTDKLVWAGGESGNWRTTTGTIGDGKHNGELPWELDSTPSEGDNHFYNTDDVVFTNDSNSLKTVNIKEAVNPASILVDGTGNFNFVNDTGSITGAGSFVKQGTGTLTMSGANSSFTGAFTLENGVVELKDSLALGSTGVINYTKGSFIFAANFDLSSRLNMQGTSIDMTVEENCTVNAGDKLSNIAITKAGTGTLTMNLVADQTKDITLTAGSLEMTLSTTERSITGSVTGAGILTLKGGLARMSEIVSTNILLDAATLTWLSNSTDTASITMTNGSSLIAGIATSNRSLILTGANSLGSSLEKAQLTGDITTDAGLTILGMAGTHSLTLTGNMAVSGTLNLADTAKLTIGAATGKTQSFAGISVGDQSTLTVAGNVNLGGSLTGAGTLNLAGGTMTATAAWSNALATTLSADTTLNTGAYDVDFNGALTGTDALTLTKTGAGTLTLNAVSSGNIDLAGGSLDLTGKASTINLTVSGTGTSLSGANALATGSTININGSLTTNGDVAAEINLNTEGSLSIASGTVQGNLNVAGTTMLNKAETAAWTSMDLAANAVLDYQVAGATANLVLGGGQRLTANAGSALNGGLSLDGGTFILGMANLANGGTVMSLQSGSLNVLSATSIDISSVSLNQRGDYTFTLLSGAAGNIFDINLLSLTGVDSLNLLATPVLRMDNGKLMLDLKAAASLVWNGTTTGNIWSNSDSDMNWLYESVASGFKEHDFVIFDDTAADGNVSLANDITIGNLRPTSMTVDSTLGYTFTGTGNISATGQLIKSGAGFLTFANDGVNTFEKGIELLEDAGKTTVSGKASLVGSLKIHADLDISSSAISSLSNVAGEGNILINGTGGASLSRTAGEYTGKVTVNQGVLSNQDVIGNGNLSVIASGNVTLSGISNAHLNSLKTTKAGVTISGLSGSITTADNNFVLSGGPSDQEVIHFGATGGSLDMGTLNLVFEDIALLDPTGQHTFKITDGVFGADLNKHDDFGKYTNFVVTGATGHTDVYYVLGIQGGSVTIGGLTAYENFVLDVNNKWTPHITQKELAKFNAAEFKANETDLFQSVTVDGVLQLIGKDAFTLNSLSGASTGWTGLTDGAALTINGTGSVYHGTLAAGASKVTFSGDQSMMGRTDTGTLTLSDGAHLTVGGLTSVAGDLTLGDNAQLTINLGAEVQVGGDITLGTGSELNGFGTLTIKNEGSLTAAPNVSIDSHVIINLLNTGAATDAGSLVLGDNTITIGGLSGTGKLESGTAGIINLNVEADSSLKFQGSLDGDGGRINKLGEGTQTLAAKTTTGATYSLDVQAGTLIVEAANGDNSAEYKDITVGRLGVAPFRLARSATPRATPKPTVVINTNVTANNLTVQSDGLLVIGSDSTSASLTLTGDANFQAGSSLEMYIGNNGDKAMLQVTGNILGLNNIETLTLHAGISWQAYVKTVLFASDRELSDSIDPNKIIMNGFGNQSITKTEDDKSIIFEASRSMENNPFRDQVTGKNALAGLDLIWAANIEAGSKKTNIDASSKLGSVFNSITMTGEGNPEAHRLLAAVAGSTVTALAGSQRDDFRQQQTWIRNRTVGMGISPDFVHEDLPYVNGWIQANAGTKRIDSSGDEAGYNLNTTGGTVGFDVDMNAQITWGFAFTANYNKLTASGAESAKGRNDAYYANLFLRTQSKRWGHTLILTGGWNDAKLDRTVSGVGVNYTANGTTKGSTIGAMYEATYDYALNENKTSILQPLFNISFANASMDAYKEEGAGNAGLNVEGTDSTYGTASLGARLMGTVGESLFGRSAMGELRLQLAQDFGDETNVARVGLCGIQRDVIGSKVGKTSVQIGAGITVPITEAGALYMDVNTDFRSKATDVNGSIGYRVNF